jgi:predicted TIM-barrel fold metal-dependent hydrolase
MLALPLTVASAQSPAGDYHQHLSSPAMAAVRSTPTTTAPSLAAKELIAILDSAGIQKAMVLSIAYMYGAPIRVVEDEEAKARAENDWTASQVAEYPTRLFAACSVNPIKAYALREIARCGNHPVLRRALKLHFGNSDVRTDLSDQLEQLKRVFQAANANRMAIIVHMHANINNSRPYGTEQGRVFFEQLLPLAKDVPVQIAHLAGAGGAGNVRADSVVAVFAEAIARGDERMKNVWFDISAVVDRRVTPAQAEKVAGQIRRLGVGRILYGTDAVGGVLSARDGWAAFRTIPLTETEFRTIAANTPPYMR